MTFALPDDPAAWDVVAALLLAVVAMVVIPAAASAATARGMDRLKRGFLHYSMANERRRSRRRARPGSIGVNTNRKVSYL
jgi:hypothetical protein